LKPTLLIIAAGMGSRYGSLKQIDSLGPNGEIIIDYSIYDAIRAGFGKLVFVIRHHFEDSFKKIIGSKLDGIVETAFAYQELEYCLDGFPLPPQREKPWGTGHAILVARDQVNEPFAVINADDYYGPNGYKIMYEYLNQAQKQNANDYSMVGYTLRNTLSDYGCVSRGVCDVDQEHFMNKITERTKIEKHNNGARYFNEDGIEHYLSGDEIVSMNFWGFQPSIFDHISVQFKEYLREHGQELKNELFLPSVVDRIVETGQGKVKVLPTDDNWFGVTYKQDKPIAQACIRELIDKGVYPEKLWEGQ